jgi:large conductance mechanosensitive channel
MGMIKEFKEFALKGNLIDIAVGFVMGAAFGKVTGSFIDGIVMPVVGLIQGKDLSNWKYVLKKPEMDSSGAVTAEEVSIKYGDFISVVIEFLVVAFVMFLVIKAINNAKKKEVPAPPPGPSNEEKLLIEIRDALKR